jgi:hypothetical protein
MDMDAFTFGHPCCVALDDASVLVSCYAGERGRTGVFTVGVELPRDA